MSRDVNDVKLLVFRVILLFAFIVVGKFSDGRLPFELLRDIRLLSKEDELFTLTMFPLMFSRNGNIENPPIPVCGFLFFRLSFPSEIPREFSDTRDVVFLLFRLI